VIPLSDGSGLRLTTAKYFTPKGRSIHGTGIEPDIVVEPPRPAAQAAAHQLREADMQKQRPAAPPQERKIGDDDGDTGVPIGRPEVGDVKTDIQLQRALEILKATRILERSVEPTKSPS
jgi:carboxyl-terminal processing protease